MSDLDAVRGGTGRAASPLELFFDLVYVFAITQVVSLIHHDPTFAGLGHGALLLFIMWWTWSIYTWTTNWTGTSSTAMKLFMLTAMGATLLMATAVQGAFGDSALLFGATLFAVRIVAAALYWVASKDYQTQRAAFFTFFPVSFLAAALFLVGGLLGGGRVLPLFLIGAAVDLFSAAHAGRGSWAVDARHFAERNGLFVIIALGESVVGISLAATHVALDTVHLAALVVSFAGAGGLWWAYFNRAAPEAERHMSSLTGYPRGRFARDAYTLLHLPMVIGIVLFAVALEQVVAHPADPLELVSRVALAAGMALVLLGIATGGYLVTSRLPLDKVLAAVALLGLAWVGGRLSALAFAAMAVLLLTTALLFERRRQPVATATRLS